jgi:hypothetical protein
MIEISNEEYHAHHALSSSDIKAVASKSLAHWKGAVRKESVAFDLGTAVHALLLEPEKDLVVRGPETRRGKAWSDLYAECNEQGKVLLTEADYDQAQEMADACLKNHAAHHFLTHSELIAEASFFAEDADTGLELKTRPDGLLLDHGIVIDIKTCQDASPRGFEKAVRQFGYDLQAAFYLHVLRQCKIPAKQMIFICIEKDKPHVTACHELSEMYVQHAHNRMMDTLFTIRDAKENDEYPTLWPDINTIHLPSWMESSDAF